VIVGSTAADPFLTELILRAVILQRKAASELDLSWSCYTTVRPTLVVERQGYSRKRGREHDVEAFKWFVLHLTGLMSKESQVEARVCIASMYGDERRRRITPHCEGFDRRVIT
jgi:hypothetical protein